MADTTSLNLKPIQLFEARQVLDDLGNTRLIDYRYTEAAAKILAKDKGWYGGDGIVEEVTLYTDGIRLYKVSDIGEKPLHDPGLENKEVLDSIINKLSKTELIFLGINTNE